MSATNLTSLALRGGLGIGTYGSETYGTAGQVLVSGGGENSAMSWSSTPSASRYLADTGTASLPSFSFTSDPDSGMFSAGANSLSFAVGGSTLFNLSNSIGTFTAVVQSSNGTAGTPTYSFTSDTDCGLYRVGTNSIGLATGGAVAITIDSSQKTQFANIISTPLGSASVPVYTFTADSDTGMYSPGSNQLALVAGGSAYLTLASSVLTANQKLATTAGIVGVTDASNATAGNIGEEIKSTVSATNFPTSTQYGDLTSISLTAGDWDVTVHAQMNPNGATVTDVSFGIGLVTGNSSSGLSGTDNLSEFTVPAGGTTLGFHNQTVAGYRINVSTTTIVYLKYQAAYSVATPTGRGTIRARRRR